MEESFLEDTLTRTVKRVISHPERAAVSQLYKAVPAAFLKSIYPDCNIVSFSP